MCMENQKVYFPCYGRCEFGNLQEAVDYVKNMRGGLYVYIVDIVLYNIRFRDCLRANGVDAVIQMLIDEAPIIALDFKGIDHLKKMWHERLNEHVADYDIQCLLKNNRICIDDCWFDGLDDVEAQVEMSGNPRHTYSKWYARQEYKQNPSGLHIGNIWESYPVFDSYDASDGRSYNNYVFSKQPLTEEMMELYCKETDSNFNACMVNENIPAHLLPILYYNGDSDYVLLATAKKSKRWFQFFK